ncbi:TonB-dependent receptor domain-containing protein [Bdellovibrio reynosensis]|uniref:TonB-dependent receptor n=1 Tax=Bdellovibrio reynosensis TaxID=2835041 RepID=A0ABY4C9G0_9BACT|nr:TonB-dependent receptor [Bdellovibrio reynosensis]UOF01503.1 TonB-dependent receptor [Bdellovibrio reynosensis]
MSLKSLSLILLLSFSQSTFAQETTGESRISERSYLLDTIQVSEEKEDDKEKAYNSINSETVIPKAALTKGNPRDVSELLQKAPGVSVSGGAELQNKKISIRGLDGFRVIQQVDGAQRLEATQQGMSSGVAVETEMLSEIAVQNGADSVSSINGAIGGTIQYKTITPEDILIGKEEISTKVKVAGDSATEGQATSLHTAAKLDKSSSALFGVTVRNSNKVESGSPNETGDSRQSEEIKANRNTFLGKYVRKTGTVKTDVKAEFSDSQTKNAAYSAGFGESNSDYRSTTFETVLNHEHSLNSNFKYEFLSYYNKTESIKDTHTAFRGMKSTLGKTDDRLENTGAKLAGVSLLPINSDLLFQTKYGIEGIGSRISEDDGTNSPYFGKSQGYDAGVFTENSLSINEDKVVVMAGARYSKYHRESDKLALEAPSKDDDTLSTMVGVSYAPAEWVKISGKYGVSNRAPNVREMYMGTGVAWKCHRPAKDCTSVPNAKLNEEQAFSKEASILFKTPETVEPKRLKVTYFDETISDYIEYMPEMYRLENGARVKAGPKNATHREYQYRNLSKVLRHGAEAQAQMDYGNWEFETMYSMIRMDCIDCPDMYTATTISEPLVSAPADKFGVAAGYEFKSINLEVGADAQFVSAQRNLSERYLLAGYGTPSYDVYGLNMRWSPRVRDVGQFDVGLGISNLFDRKYVVHNSPSGTFELGRNYSLSLATIF